MTLRPCKESSAAKWITNQKIDWDELAKFGPTGEFSRHARVLYAPDNDADPWIEIEDERRPGVSDAEILAEVCEALRDETSTADNCYFCLWDGWPDLSHLVRDAAVISIPNRQYYLFEGSISDIGRWSTTPTPRVPPAAFVWPADRAWCVASDVDVSWAGVSATHQAIDRLANEPRLVVRPANTKKW